jgi:hypothetical protein
MKKGKRKHFLRYITEKVSKYDCNTSNNLMSWKPTTYQSNGHYVEKL